MDGYADFVQEEIIYKVVAFTVNRADQNLDELIYKMANNLPG
jgi:hypothetical protein